MKEKTIDILKNLIIILIFAILISIPYLNSRVVFGDDISYHLNRIIEISKQLKLGNIPVLIHPNLLNGFGYANSLFYPELFLYIPAIIMFSGINIFTTYKIFILIINFFTILFTYYSAKRIFKNKITSITITILYTTAFYRIVNLYVRSAIGEVLAFTFLPLILAGLYEIIFGDNKNWWIICFGIFGISNSHVLSLAMTIVLILTLCLINIIKIFKNKKRLLNLFLAGFISILLICSFVLPYIEQSRSDKFNVDEKIWGPDLVEENSVSLKDIVFSTVNSENCRKSIGILLLILPFFIFFCKNKSKENSFIKQIFIIGFISLILSSNIFPWKELCSKFPVLTTIQFPYRLNTITTLLFSFVGGYNICYLLKNNEKLTYIIDISLVLISLVSILTININIRNYNEDEIINLAPEGNGEYIPYNFYDDDINVHNIYSGENIEFIRNGSKIQFDYEDSKNNMVIHMPLAYYKGYIAYIEQPDGKITKLDVSNYELTKNLIVSSDKIINGKLTVEYKMTNVQKIAYSITYITLLLLICYLLIHKLNIKKIKTFDNEKTDFNNKGNNETVTNIEDI